MQGISTRGMMSLDTMSAAEFLILTFCYFLWMLLVRSCRGLFSFRMIMLFLFGF